MFKKLMIFYIKSCAKNILLIFLIKKTIIIVFMKKFKIKKFKILYKKFKEIFQDAEALKATCLVKQIKNICMQIYIRFRKEKKLMC